MRFRAPQASLFLLVPALLLNGCAPLRRYAMNQAANVLADSTTTFHDDNDPELIRESLPFALKLIEGTLTEAPRHRKLLIQACSGFTEYAWGFIRQDADEMEDEDFEEAEALRLRCKKLLLRARGYGLRAMEVRCSGMEAALRQDPVAAIKRLRKGDVENAYWLGACWGAAISLDKNDTELLADQNIVFALLDRALELNPGFDHGAIHDLMITLSMVRTDSPKPPVERAKAHYREALALSEGMLASPHVGYAESVCQKEQDRKGFEAALRKALAIDVDAHAEVRTVNCVMQRRARWLLDRVDDLFID